MPTGPALVGKAELIAFLDLEDADELGAGADLMLELSSDTVRDELGQRIDYVEDDVEEVRGEGTDVLLLPELPVVDVTSVTIPGEDGNVDEELTEAAGDFRLERGREGRFAILRRRGGNLWPRRPVVVTYSHGYELSGSGDLGRIPGAIRLVVLRATARTIANPDNVRQESVGRYSVTFDGTPEVTDLDRKTLGPFYPGSKAGRR